VCGSSCTLVARTGNVCGDNVLDPDGNELCEEGNTVTETSCAYGTASCQKCDGGCDNLLNLTGNICGDGSRDLANEACDDTNVVTETACPYGQATCTGCDGTEGPPTGNSVGCEAVLNLTGNVCGDGNQGGPEGCDDGNTITEGACTYGTASCNVCNASCQPVARTGNVCGDGNRDTTFEACDDNNTDSCGLCSSGCNAVQNAAATGTIAAVKGSDLDESQDCFTINDGFGHSVIFEFSTDATLGCGTVRIDYGASTSASTMRDRIKTAINNQASLLITASNGATSTVVALTHDTASSLGNVAITTSVDEETFLVSGMSGGAGRDCGAGVECSVNGDCASNVCTSGLCVGP